MRGEVKATKRRAASLAACLLVAGLICRAASGQYCRNFEIDDEFPFQASGQGVVLTGQDGFYLPPAGGKDFRCYTYADNAVGVIPYPDGQLQFVAGISTTGPTFARAQRDIQWGSGRWSMVYDVFIPLPTVVEQNLGSVSPQPHVSPPSPPEAQSMIHLFSWVDTNDPSQGWQAGYIHYDANDAEVAQPGSFPGPEWRNLRFNQWYHFITVVDFDVHQIIFTAIRDLVTGVSTGIEPVGWYLRGGGTGAPIPTAFRLFVGATSAGGNIVAWDHLCIRPTVHIAGSGDMNCDGIVNFGDIDPFVLALSDPAGYDAEYPGCHILNGDLDGDGRVTFGDIDGFVAVLAGDDKCFCQVATTKMTTMGNCVKCPFEVGTTYVDGLAPCGQLPCGHHECPELKGDQCVAGPYQCTGGGTCTLEGVYTGLCRERGP